MKSGKLRLAVATLTAAAMLCIAGVAPSYAQSAQRTVTLWVNQKTGQVFIRPGRGRTPLELPTSAFANQVESNVESKTQASLQQNDQKVQAALQTQKQQTQQLATKVKAMEPGWQDYMNRWKGKFSLSTEVFADWRMYTHTSFQPQEITQINNPGPGNSLFNSFDITRTYITLKFTPTPGWLVNITPNIYRQYGKANSVSFGKNSTLGSNLNGNLGFRLKTAAVSYSKLFDDIPMLRGGKVTFGQTANPLVAWEEHLFGYRYAQLTPWNYLSLSSTQVGLMVGGPIRFGETKYADYQAGVYDNSAFHSYGQSDLKQVMGRISLYPLGGWGKHYGLGFTGFYNYGYGNVPPDSFQAHVTRIAALVHYTTKRFGIAFEYDNGHDAFSSGHLFSGSAPSSTSQWAYIGTLAGALLNTPRSDQQGFDVFGHYNIPHTKLSVFGLGMWFMPNTNVKNDPYDFQHFVAGVQYKYNKYLRFALASQNTLFYHSQKSFSEAYANTFSPGTYTPGTGYVTDAVPRDTHAIFLDMQFNY